MVYYRACVYGAVLCKHIADIKYLAFYCNDLTHQEATKKGSATEKYYLYWVFAQTGKQLLPELMIAINPL